MSKPDRDSGRARRRLTAGRKCERSTKKGEMMIIKPTLFNGTIQIEQDSNIIELSNEDIARIIRVRFLFDRFNWEDLAIALTVFQNTTGRRQIDIETVIKEVNALTAEDDNE